MPNLPTLQGLRTPLLSCLIGAVGGAAFAWAGAPLPWLLGAMLINAAAALMGWRPMVPVRWRNLGLVVLGATVGSTYNADSMNDIGSWLGSMAVIAGYSLIVGGLCTLYLRKCAGFSLPTAYFSAMPGGMNEMVIVGEQMGADARIVALSHAVRVLVVVTLVAFGFRLLTDYVRPNLGASGPLDTVGLLVLMLVAVVSVVIAQRIRLPAPFFLGPLLGSLVLHATGYSDVAPPYPLLALAQVVVGSSLGARFAGTTWSEITGTAKHAFAVSLLQLLITGVIACLAAQVLPQDAPTLLLGMAPAGIAEMSLIAMAVGYDVAFVAIHQLTRLLLVFMAAPTFFRLSRARADT